MQFFSDVVQDHYGNVQPSVSVTVKLGGTTATLYSDNGVTTKTNPVVSDASGVISFYAANGTYTLWVSGTQVGTVVLQDSSRSADTVIGFDARGTADGASVVFSGRSSADDGGGGTFIYRASSTQTADNVLVFAPTGGGRLFRQGWTSSGFEGVIDVRWGGAVGDGVTDDTSALNAVSAATPLGAQVRFGPNKTYLITAQVTWETAGKIDLNGSTIKASGQLITGARATGFYWGKQLASYTLGSPFSVTSGQTQITLPVEVTPPAVGSLIHFKSNTVRVPVTGMDYYNGYMAVVESVSGQVITVSTAAYAAFQIDAIVVYRGYPGMLLENGIFDWTGCTNVVTTMQAVAMYGTNMRVDRCIAKGNLYAGVGFRLTGENARVTQSAAHGFINYQGISASGRLGYGFAVFANNAVVEGSTGTNNKHSMTSGPRDAVVQNVHYKDCGVFEDSTLSSDYFTASLDFHSNVLGAKVTGCNVSGSKTVLNVRCESAFIEDNTFVSQLPSAYLISAFEMGYDGLTFKNNRVTMQASSRLLGTDSSNSGISYFRNVIIEGNQFLSSSGSLFKASLSGASIDGLRIRRNKFSGDSLYDVSGATSISNVEVEENECPSLNTSLFLQTVPSAVSFVNFKVNRNKAISASGGSTLVNMFPTNSSARDLVIDGLEINDNQLDASAAATNSYGIALGRVDATRASIRGNRVYRVGTFRGFSFNDVQITAGFIADNICDQNMVFTASSVGLSLVRTLIERNIIDGTMTFSETSADLCFTDSAINRNTLGTASFSNRVGSTAWANSNELSFFDNRTRTGGVTISANSTGHKIRSKGGTYYTALVDNSATYYSIPTNVVVLSGSAIAWKGSTTVTQDGKLRGSAIPTTGTWAVNDRVENSAPSAGGPYGWVCVVAGTPGTWSTY